jgi:phosphatidylserine decarboxylase
VTNSPDDTDLRRLGGWLPSDQDELERWLAGLRDRADAEKQVELHPVITEFQELIDRDAIVRMYVEQMIAQEPRTRQYQRRHLEDVPQMLRLINAVLTTAPEFSESAPVVTPLTAVLEWTMGTPAGFAAYRDPRVNEMVKKILLAYGEFLDSGDSRYVLDESPSGWKSPAARRAIGIEQFVHDPDDPYWGFASWNDFFTRRFREGQRPVAAPDDDSVIANACESTPYGIAADVRRQDSFWLKSQPYSLQDLLGNDPVVDEFVGGTVYQAYLSAMNYHRWHSPVSGTVIRAWVQPGTYYSEADSEGPAAVEPQHSQSYLAHVATRAIILIEADNPAIGLVAFAGIGMTDVSSCVIRPDLLSGGHVSKGDELGHFQFGGSTYCLIFRSGVVADFALAAVPRHAAGLVHVNSHLATVAG